MDKGILRDSEEGSEDEERSLARSNWKHKSGLCYGVACDLSNDDYA